MNEVLDMAGILLWTRKDGRTLHLFRKINGKFRDVGGKLTTGDEMDSAIAAFCRELQLFTPEQLYWHIVNCSHLQYNAKCHYFLFRVWCDPSVVSSVPAGYQWRHGRPYKLHVRLRGLQI